jgi:sRNA-binding protein
MLRITKDKARCDVPGTPGLDETTSLGLTNRSGSTGLPESRQPAETIALFADRWPNCFAVYEKNRKPLKIGIDKEVLAALAGEIAVGDVLAALRIYTGNKVYLKECRAAKDRIGLDGAVAGTVTESEQAYAARRLKARKPTDKPRKPQADKSVRKLHPANADKPTLTLRGLS